MRVSVYLVDIIPEAPEAFRFNAFISQAFLQRVNTGDVIAVLIETVHEEPETLNLVFGFPVCSVGFVEFDLVKKFNESGSDIRKILKIFEDLLPVIRYVGIACKVRDYLGNYGLFLGFGCDLFAYDIKTEIVKSGIFYPLIANFLATWIEKTEFAVV